MTAHDAALARRRLDVARAYGLAPATVEQWTWRSVDVFHRKAIDLGLIQPTDEDTDDTEVLPF